ncbi:MAG: hypothetical protein M3139_06230 [Bacteroidota bacterium]|nr:hypothetical protein [Bacteroidota bacterium]
MATKIGIAYSNRINSEAAVIEAASKAMKSRGIIRPDFALAFCNSKHTPDEFLENVQSVPGNVPLISASSIVIITDEFIGYEGFEAGVTVFITELPVALV